MTKEEMDRLEEFVNELLEDWNTSGCNEMGVLLAKLIKLFKEQAYDIKYLMNNDMTEINNENAYYK